MGSAAAGPPGRRARLGIGLGLIAVGGLLALPASASAAITCDFSGSVLSVTLSANNEFPIIDRSGENIRVIDNSGPTQVEVPCTNGPATVTTTERIEVNQPDPGEAAQLVIDQAGGAFEPGTGGPAEGGGTSEIEFDVDLGDGFDTVHLSPRADPFSDHLRLGALDGDDSGANLNPPEVGGPDGDDLRLTRVDSITVALGFDETVANTYDGGGGPEFSGPLTTIPMGGLGGGGGPDTVIGGSRGGIYDGFDGDDTLLSSPESPFSETLRGGPGTDTLDYSRATSAVTVSLGISAGQDTGGGGFDVLDHSAPVSTEPDFENLTGGPFGDTLTGTDIANRVVGADGSDILNLLDGADEFDVMDGEPDTVSCGDGVADSGVADEQGVDTINADCETVDFPPQTSIAAGPANGATITDRTPTYALAADEAATFERRVDGGTFQACPASCTIPSLSIGPHTLAFRATDQDSPATPDPSPATRTLTISTPQPSPPDDDNDSPETEITKGPKTKTKKKAVTFEFRSDEGGSTFECAVDDGQFATCASPLRVKARKKGRHSFQARAIDPAGNIDNSPDTHTWKRKKNRR